MPTLFQRARTAGIGVLVGASSVSPVVAQDAAPEAIAPAPATDGAPSEVTAEPIVPTLELPPMPAPEADFSADRDLFLETTTDAERARREEIAAGERLAEDGRPLWQRWPRLTIGAQAVGGAFGSAVIALLGGSIGEAIDPGDRRFPLGGPHGPLFGGLAGSLVGVIGGVWGTGLLFEKDPGLGWTSLGAGVGTVVGAGAAAGFALGLDKGDTTTTLAVGSFLAFQVAGTVVFNDLFARRGVPVPAAGKAPIAPPRGRTGPALDEPDAWIFPVTSGAF
jgi:hypothetical protein